MNLSQLDLNLLVALDLLLEERSVTLAAEKAGITQPAMSNTLRRLREHFEDPLLVKSSQGKMIPTEQALKIAPLVKPALHGVDQVFSFKNDFDPLHSTQRFRILTNDDVESLLFPQLLNVLGSKAPKITLDILPFNNSVSIESHTIQQLESGVADLAIGKLDDLPPSVHRQVLFDDQLICIVRQGHPILEKGLDLKSFSEERHLMISLQGIGPGPIDLELAKQNLKRHVAYYTRNFIMAPKLVGQSDLIASIPRRIAELYADSEGLQLLAPPFPSVISFCISQVWSNYRHTDPALQWLRNEINLLFAEGT